MFRPPPIDELDATGGAAFMTGAGAFSVSVDVSMRLSCDCSKTTPASTGADKHCSHGHAGELGQWLDVEGLVVPFNAGDRRLCVENSTTADRWSSVPLRYATLRETAAQSRRRHQKRRRDLLSERVCAFANIRLSVHASPVAVIFNSNDDDLQGSRRLSPLELRR